MCYSPKNIVAGHKEKWETRGFIKSLQANGLHIFCSTSNSLNADLLEEVHIGRLKTKSTVPSKWRSAPEVIAGLISDLNGNYSWAMELLRNYLSAKLLLMHFGTKGPQRIKMKVFAFPSTLWGYMREEKERRKWQVFAHFQADMLVPHGSLFATHVSENTI